MEHRMTFGEFEDLVYGLLDSIEEDVDAVVSINRDGLVAGVTIAHALGSQHGVVGVSHYDGTGECGDISYDGDMVDHIDECSTVLLVDDVVGTGETMRTVVSELEQTFASVVTASVIDSVGYDYSPEYSAVSTEDRVIFPWQCVS